jgi:hypothetical protein
VRRQAPQQATPGDSSRVEPGQGCGKTGTIGIGKTTVIRRVADKVNAERLRGFYTEKIRERGERRGFQLVSFDGTARVIAHVDFPKSRRVGKYGVDVRALDEATVPPAGSHSELARHQSPTSLTDRPQRCQRPSRPTCPRSRP